MSDPVSETQGDENCGFTRTNAIVTWVTWEGSECQIEGALQLVNAEQVIVTISQHAVCCIPRRYVTRIESLGKQTPALGVESNASWTSTPATTPAASAAGAGNGDARDIHGVVMQE